MSRAKGIRKLISKFVDDASEKVGTATMPRTGRQKKRPSNVVQRDPKTGRVRSVSRAERVERGKNIGKVAGATVGVPAAGLGAAKGAEALGDKAEKAKKKQRIGTGNNMYLADGRLNITQTNLDKSGLSLRQYSNYMKKNKKRPPNKEPVKKRGGKMGGQPSAYANAKAKKPVNKMGGGMMRSKMASKGGARGGRKPMGMKAGGFPDLTGDGKVTQADILKGRGVTKKAKGGMMKKKGYKAGGMAKKGYSKGGAVRRGKPRGVGAAKRGFGKALR